MKVLIVGGDGQLGRSLQVAAPTGFEIVAYGRDALDITDRRVVDATVAALTPKLIFNAAAYTAVDSAEDDEVRARAINTTAVGSLERAARDVGARLVHISTDFVFDGRSGVPYAPNAEPNPLNAYGRTKLAGEYLVGPENLIVRTSWLHAPEGANFVRTMLRLMSDKSEVRVVADQVGTPTYAPGFAAALWALAANGVAGLYHYSDAGVASWYDFAVAIREEALASGLLRSAALVVPITTADFPTPAIRPRYSVLDKSLTFEALGCPAPHWRDNLRVMIKEIRANG